jgi:hypothetical protein
MGTLDSIDISEDKPDERYWLPDGYDLITPERESKGDMRVERRTPDKEQLDAGRGGQIFFAQVQVRNILNFLSDETAVRAYCKINKLAPMGAVLDGQHAHNGRTYEVWQTIFHARQGYRNNPIYTPELAELRKALKGDGFDVSDFIAVIRTLSLEQKKLIEFAIYQTATDHLKWLALRTGNAYLRAFDRLSEIMEPMRERARAVREAAPQE